MVVGGIAAPQRITLWDSNSVLEWRMIDETFRNQEEFSLVESAIYASTAMWNRIAPAGVTFQRVDENERPSFNIVLQEQGTNTVAVAFYPTEYMKRYSREAVYDSGVLPQNSTSLTKILCHEYGHVLGFRHSFALLK